MKKDNQLKIIIHLQDNFLAYGISNSETFLFQNYKKILENKIEEKFFKSLEESIKELKIELDQIIHNSNYLFEDVDIFLATSNLKYQSKILNFQSENKKITLDPKFLQNYIFKKNENEISDVLTKLELNSYPVFNFKNYINQNFNQIKSYYYSTEILEKDFIQKIKDIVDDYFPLVKINFYSYNEAFLSYIFEIINPLEDDFIFLKTNANNLVLNIVKNQSVEKIIHFNFNLKEIIQKIQEKHNFMNFETARSRLKQYLNDELIGLENKKIEEVFKEKINELKNILEEENIKTIQYSFYLKNKTLMDLIVNKEVSKILPNFILIDGKVLESPNIPVLELEKRYLY